MDLFDRVCQYNKHNWPVLCRVHSHPKRLLLRLFVSVLGRIGFGHIAWRCHAASSTACEAPI